jgi:hypothetical protein
MKFNVTTNAAGTCVNFPAWGKYVSAKYVFERNAMRQWCKETIPLTDWEDHILFGKLVFVHESDAMLFITKFS